MLLLAAAVCVNLTAADLVRSAPQENDFKVARRWDFNSYGNTEGWTIPDSLNGAVMGGSLWLTIQRIPPVKQPPIAHQIWGSPEFADIDSPKGLGIRAQDVTKVRMRILNLSPETDGYLFWRTKENPEADAGILRFTMKPSLNEWQEVVCHVDNSWKGTINQIRIRPGLLSMRGDIWIDWVAITDGAIRPAKPHHGETFIHVEYAAANPIIGGHGGQRTHDVFVRPAPRTSSNRGRCHSQPRNTPRPCRTNATGGQAAGVSGTWSAFCESWGAMRAALSLWSTPCSCR
jgi:hypothetical protein